MPSPESTESSTRSRAGRGAVFDRAPDAMLVVDGAGAVVDANRRATVTLGLSAERLMACSIEELAAPTDGETDPMRVGAARLHDELRFEQRLRRGDGGSVRADIAISALPGNEWMYVIRPCEAETRREPARVDEIEKSSEYYRHLFSANNAVKMLVDEEGQVVDANEAATEFYGYARDRFLGMNISTFVMAPREVLQERIERGFRQTNPVYTSTHQRSDGERREVEVHVSSVRIKGRRLLFAIIHDVTERVAAEEALRESEERFRQLAEHIDAIFWLRSANHRRTVYLSPAFERIWGLSREAVYESTEAAFDLIVAADRARVRGFLHVADRGAEVEYRVRRPDGFIRWLKSRSFPIRDHQGNLLRIAGITEDITSIRDTEETLRRNEERYRQLARSRQRLLDELNHRVKNNLAGLLSLVDMVKSTVDSTEEFANAIGRRIQAMNSIHTVLSDANWDAIDLGQLVRVLTDQHEHGLEPRIRLTLDGPALDVSPPQAGPIALILLELLTNWRKHVQTPEQTEVKLSWHVLETTPHVHRTRIVWQEAGSDLVGPPDQPGLGLNLISGFARFELGGKVEFEFGPPGLQVALEAMLERPRLERPEEADQHPE